MSEYYLEIHGVSKAFQAVQALDNVELRLRPGEIKCLAMITVVGRCIIELQVVFLFAISPVSPAGKPSLSSEMPKIGSDFSTFRQLNFWMVCSTLCVRELVIFVSNIHKPESFD